MDLFEAIFFLSIKKTKLKNLSGRIQNNDKSMLEMKGVSDNYNMLVTFLAISATNCNRQHRPRTVIVNIS